MSLCYYLWYFCLWLHLFPHALILLYRCYVTCMYLVIRALVLMIAAELHIRWAKPTAPKSSSGWICLWYNREKSPLFKGFYFSSWVFQSLTRSVLLLSFAFALLLLLLLLCCIIILFSPPVFALMKKTNLNISGICLNKNKSLSLMRIIFVSPARKISPSVR